MRNIDKLKRLRPHEDHSRFLDFEVKEVGRRTFEWMKDPEGEARRIWNSVRKKKAIPAGALESQSSFEEFIKKESEGLITLVKEKDFYSKVLTFEGEELYRSYEDLKEKKKFASFRKTLVGKTIKEVATELPYGLKAEEIVIGEKKTIYIRDEKTGRFKTHF